MRINFYRSPNTMLMVNSIDIASEVNQTPSAKNEDIRIF